MLRSTKVTMLSVCLIMYIDHGLIALKPTHNHQTVVQTERERPNPIEQSATNYESKPADAILVKPLTMTRV